MKFIGWVISRPEWLVTKLNTLRLQWRFEFKAYREMRAEQAAAERKYFDRIRANMEATKK